MNVSKEARIGVVVAVGIAILVYGFNFLKGRNFFSEQRNFYAVYYHVDGLVEANAIQINGLKIGRVQSIKLLPGAEGKIIVSFSVTNDDAKIPSNSIAKIISSDLMGPRAIQIMLGNSNVYAQFGDTLSSDIQASLGDEVNAQVKPLKQKAENLILSIDSVMSVVQAVFNQGARDNLTKSFESIKLALGTFQKTSLRLDTLVASEKVKLSFILSKIESISSNIANSNDKLTNVINNFSSISDSLAQANIKSAIENTNVALQLASGIMDKINKGEGSLGLLVNDKGLYQHLDSAATNVNTLVNDLQAHPKRYVHFSVFGKKDKTK